MAKSIIVNIKFDKDEKTGKVLGFVTRSNGDWKGCRVNDNIKKRKIVMPGYQVYSSIIPGVLYHATLLPMDVKEGFVAIKAEPVQFSGKIASEEYGNRRVLSLRFGNKNIIFDPASKDPKYSSLEDIVNHISHRYDILDAYETSVRFNNEALALIEYLNSIKS